MAIKQLTLQDKNEMEDQHTICRLPRSIDKTQLKETYGIFFSDPEELLYRDLEDAINFSTLEDLDDMASRAMRFLDVDHFNVVAPTQFQNPMDRLMAVSAFGNDYETRLWVREYFFNLFNEALLMEGDGIFYAVNVPTFGGTLLVRSSSVETAGRVSRDRLERLRRGFSKTMFGDLSD